MLESCEGCTVLSKQMFNEAQVVGFVDTNQRIFGIDSDGILDVRCSFNEIWEQLYSNRFFQIKNQVEIVRIFYFFRKKEQMEKSGKMEKMEN